MDLLGFTVKRMKDIEPEVIRCAIMLESQRNDVYFIRVSRPLAHQMMRDQPMTGGTTVFIEHSPDKPGELIAYGGTRFTASNKTSCS